MTRARRATPHQKGRGKAVLITAGAAVIAIAGVAIAAQLSSDGGSGTSQPPASSAPDTGLAAGAQTPTQTPTQTPAQTPTATPTTARAAADPAAACAAEITATDEVVKSARIAAGHWREHVQARTDLLAGKNTEAITKAIWKRTRLAGPADQARLDAATAAQQKAAGGCRRLTTAAAPACKKHLAALTAAAATGRAASGDWAAHLAMMKAHAAGDFGAEHAQHLWVAAWQNAPKNLNAFAQAETVLRKAPTCRPT